MTPPGARLARAWSLLAGRPGGRWLFSRLLGFMVPYSGTIGATVHELEAGRAVLSIRERRRLRNHLGSVHAIALANLGELSSGLAMTLALPPGVIGIPVRIEVEYRKKARGVITAVGTADPPAETAEETEALALAHLEDEAGDRVAECRVTWKLRSPR